LDWGQIVFSWGQWGQIAIFSRTVKFSAFFGWFQSFPACFCFFVRAVFLEKMCPQQRGKTLLRQGLASVAGPVDLVPNRGGPWSSGTGGMCPQAWGTTWVVF
jgi:hypothetical protein